MMHRRLLSTRDNADSCDRKLQTFAARSSIDHVKKLSHPNNINLYKQHPQMMIMLKIFTSLLALQFIIVACSGIEMESERLWLFEDVKSSNPNYLYVLNENNNYFNNMNGSSNNNNNNNNESLSPQPNNLRAEDETHPGQGREIQRANKSILNNSTVTTTPTATDCQFPDCSQQIGNREYLKRQGTSNDNQQDEATLLERQDYDTSASIFRISTNSSGSSSSSSGGGSSGGDGESLSLDARSDSANPLERKNSNSLPGNNDNNQKVRDTNNDNNNKANSAKKSNKLNFFKGGQSKKISLTSLLPKSKRQDSSPSTSQRQTNNQNGNNNNNNNKQQFMPSSPRGGFHSKPHHVIPYTNSHLLFGATIPGFTNHHQNHFFNFAPPPRPEDMIGGQTIQTQQTIPQPSYHHYAQQMDFGKQNDFTPIFYHPPGPNRSGQLVGGKTPVNNNNNKLNNNNNNNNNKNQTRNDNSNNQNSNPVQHPLSSLPIGAAAAALLSERAKSFISQLNRGGSGSSGTNKNSSGRNNRDASGNNNNGNNGNGNNGNTNNGGGGGMMKSASDQVGLASIIKNAADVWAASNPGAGASPSIIVEHDGPTITTVDFGASGSAVPPTAGRIVDGDQPEEEEVSTFFEDEETEMVGGSHDAKRIVKLKHHSPPPHHHHHYQHQHPLPHHPYQQQQHQHHQGQQPHQHHHHSTRHPFDQPVQSHHVQTELPMDSFYSMDSDFNGRGKKLMSPMISGGHDFSQDVIHDYMHLQRHIDQPQQQQQQPYLQQQLHQNNYPDSINAIKEQNNNNNNNNINNNNNNNGENGKVGADLAATITNKLSNANNDQIEQLIRELQELNKRKRLTSDENNNGDSSSRKKLKASASSDDYEDLLGNNDEDEDERIRLLRRKLLARLRAKNERGPGGRKRGGASLSASGSNFHNEAIKIPLHALLLAALDRRMSPSEQSQTVLPENSESKSKNGASSEGEPAKQDYNEVSSGGGGGGSSNNYYDQPGTTMAPQSMINDNATIIFRESFPVDSRNDPNSNSAPQRNPQTGPSGASDGLGKQQQQEQEAYSGPSMFLTLNNMRFADDPFNLQRGNETSPSMSIDSGGGSGDMMVSNPRGFHNGSMNDMDEEGQLYSPTTRMPTIIQARLARGGTSSFSLVDNNHQQQQQHVADMAGAIPSAPSGQRSSESTKRRRDLDGQQQPRMEAGDFDVNRQVAEFVQDQDGSEPAEWAIRRVKDTKPIAPVARPTVAGGPKRATANSESVHFDDDFEEMARSTRRKILKRRRKPPGGPAEDEPAEGPAVGASADEIGEMGPDRSVAAESGFFNKIQRETMDPGADVDRSIAGIQEDSSTLADPSNPNNIAQIHSNRRPRRIAATAASNDDEDSTDESSDDLQTRQEPDEDSSSNEIQYNLPDDRQRHREVASTGHKDTSPSWKPQMVDDEVQRIEELARTRELQQQQHDESKGAGNRRARAINFDQGKQISDYPTENSDEDTQSFDGTDTAESCDTATTVSPDVSIVKLTIDSQTGPDGTRRIVRSGAGGSSSYYSPEQAASGSVNMRPNLSTSQARN